MKIRTVLVAGLAAGIGYVMGTAAGRARFEQIRGKATDFLGSPQVQDTVANLSDTVKQNASKLPDPVAGVVNAVADKAKGATGGQETSDPMSSTSDLPETPFDADSLETTMTAEAETPFASDLPETLSDPDPLETSFASDRVETSSLSDPEPFGSDLTDDTDDPINPTIPPAPTPPR